MLPEKKAGNQVPRLLLFSPPMGPTVRDPIYQEPIQSKNKLKLLMPSKWTGRDIWGCFSCDWEAGGADKEGVRLQCTGWRRDLVEWGGRVRTQLDSSSSSSSWGLTENRGSVVLVGPPPLLLLLLTHQQGGVAYQQHACRPAVSSANTDHLLFGFLPCTVVTNHLVGCDRWLRN